MPLFLKCLLVIAVSLVPTISFAQKATDVVICKKVSSGAITLRSKRCRSGEQKLSNISALTGASGRDGSLRVYGDGSAGAFDVNTYTVLNDPIQQFTDVTIEAGQTLFVPSGSVIRCSGTFRNLGSVFVGTSGFGAAVDSNASGLTVPSRGAAAAGHVARNASDGEFGSSSLNLVGGAFGLPYLLGTQQALLRPGLMGGGPGGAAGISSQGGAGGGSITILCAGAISNEGTISADAEDGANGAGGGGGGIVILASQTSISNTGEITAKGGKGGDSVARAAAGGGGSGGIVHLLAPSISAGTITLNGGAAGSTAVPVTATLRSAGGGGGASGSEGGTGADVTSLNAQGGASMGQLGVSFTTLSDPTSLF